MSEEYQRIRQREIRDIIDQNLGKYLDHFEENRETIIFLPGGMGSQLRISRDHFKADTPFTTEYPVAWLDAGILFENDFGKLEISRDNLGSYLDKDNYIVVPDAELRQLVKPYNRTREYFEQAGFNYFVFGYDWRRSIMEGADFLNYFLDQFHDRVSDQFANAENPLQNVTLLGHSQGGLVLQAWLQSKFYNAGSETEVRSKYKQVITVGAPFYGTSTHLQRYFNGENYFNQIFGKNKVRKIIGSMPGLYILTPFDESSFEKKKHILGLQNYPLINEVDDPMDPFKRQNEDFLPNWISKQALREAAAMRTALSGNLNEHVRDSVYNIYATGNSDTPVALRWDRTKSAENEPVTTQIKGKGDGTVPYWSGRISDVPDENVWDITNVDTHMGLMEDKTVLDKVLGIIKQGAVSPFNNTQPNIQPLRLPDFDITINRIKEKTLAKTDPDARETAFWRKVWEETAK